MTKLLIEAVRVERRPGPHVARDFRGGLGRRDVLLLAVAKAPNLIALNTFGGDIANVLIMVGGAGVASLDKQLGHSVEGNPDHAGDRPHGRPLDQHVEDLDALFEG